MRSFLMTSAAALCLGSAAQASSIDLTDNTFVPGSVQYQTYVQGPLGPIVQFSELVDGVTFQITAGSNQAFSSVGTWGSGTSNVSGPFALNFGGGGLSATSFTLTASADVTLDGFIGLAQLYNTHPVFDVTGTGVASTGNAFSAQGFLSTGTPATDAFVDGPLSLNAGETYTFTVTNAGLSTVGFLTGLSFTKVQGGDPGAQVPLPAGMPLLLGALGGLAMLRRRAG